MASRKSTSSRRKSSKKGSPGLVLVVVLALVAGAILLCQKSQRDGLTSPLHQIPLQRSWSESDIPMCSAADLLTTPCNPGVAQYWCKNSATCASQPNCGCAYAVDTLEGCTDVCRLGVLAR